MSAEFTQERSEFDENVFLFRYYILYHYVNLFLNRKDERYLEFVKIYESVLEHFSVMNYAKPTTNI